MARPLRIEFSGALYHITSRGNECKNIFQDDADRNKFLEILDQTIERYGWLCHAYCLMSNHYHLLIETVNPNLSKGMRHINGIYSQYYNKKYERVGHLFQGRYKAILVEKDNYLKELSRYIILNPVRAFMVENAEDWSWSSYNATVGKAEKKAFLTTDVILSCFGKQRYQAQQQYAQFVLEGINKPSPLASVKNQIYLGSDDFIENMQCHITIEQALDNVPKPQKQGPKKPLHHYDQYKTKIERVGRAYASGNYTQQELALFYAVSSTTIGRLIKQFEGGEWWT